MKAYFTEQSGFYGANRPSGLLERFGSPLYVYSETILRKRCGEIRSLLSYPNYKPNYSIKANSNLHLLNIIREEGFGADAVSPGEIRLLREAGFAPGEILFTPNNVSEDEMKYAAGQGIPISCDSLSQLKQYGRIYPGGQAVVRFNTGIGAGHHGKVVTGGENTKFGIAAESVSVVKYILKECGLKLVGVHQHIGSLFMDGTSYLESTRILLDIAGQFEEAGFADLGGGFGIPYHKQDGQERAEWGELGEQISELVREWTRKQNRPIGIKMEPGRYLTAECGVLLGTVHAVKQNFRKTYIGTDIGFNLLIRPVLYDAYHDVEIYEEGILVRSDRTETATIVGNLCESGDILAQNRELPPVREGNVIGVMDAGAYGYSMSSNYNCRLRPAEVLIDLHGEARLIRRRETVEDLMRGYA